VSTKDVKPARLLLHGATNLSAIVRCDACADVYKYPALEAAQILTQNAALRSAKRQILTAFPDIVGHQHAHVTANVTLRQFHPMRSNDGWIP
jgi:hypothetical protein